MPARTYVFGYGSLAADAAGGYVTTLPGHRRRWGVAMDNARDLPGYKHYRLAGGGGRPRAFVAFLDLAPGGGEVNGLCLPVAAADLPALDARERNYERVDVTDLVAEARGRVWAYRGSAAGRERLARGARERRLLIARAYADGVEAAFRRLGPGELEAFRASTDPPPDAAVVADLERIDLP